MSDVNMNCRERYVLQSILDRLEPPTPVVPEPSDAAVLAAIDTLPVDDPLNVDEMRRALMAAYAVDLCHAP